MPTSRQRTGGLGACRHRAARTAWSVSNLVSVFGRWLKLPLGFGQPRRRRLYTPERTFWLFLSQVLGAEPSCREAVRRFLAWRGVAEADPAVSAGTGGYCRARARLPGAALEGLHAPLLKRLTRLVPALPDEGRWCGRRVKVVDGTCVSLPDSPDNRARYPRPARQKAGCGFPMLRLVGLFALDTGLWEAAAWDGLKVSERGLYARLLPTLCPHEVVVSDRGFGGFAELALLQARGVDAVTRKSARRTTGCRVLKRFGKRERRVAWTKGRVRPRWLAAADWQALPPALTLREVDVHVRVPGFRTRDYTVVTTLLDRRAVPAAELPELYRRRWRVELFLRDLKTTLGLDPLRALSPAMADKELHLYRLAYNLLRGLLLEAAGAHGLCPVRLSFAGAVATVRQWAPVLALPGLGAERYRRLYALLLTTLARDALPDRPDRCEPRARKRRPKNYALLTQPRNQFQEIPHRNRYKKASSMKIK